MTSSAPSAARRTPPPDLAASIFTVGASVTITASCTASNAAAAPEPLPHTANHTVAIAHSRCVEHTVANGAIFEASSRPVAGSSYSCSAIPHR